MEELFNQLIVLSGYIDKVKKEKRRIWSGQHKESVADHSWGLCLLVIFCYPYMNLEVDLHKMLKIALFHDFAEALAGDTPFSEVVLHPELKEKKKSKELLAIKKISGELERSVGEEILSLWMEYEDCNSLEGSLVKALDKLEAQLQQLSTDVNKWGCPKVISSAWANLEKKCSINGFLHYLAMKIIESSFEKIEHAQFLDDSFKKQLSLELEKNNVLFSVK